MGQLWTIEEFRAGLEELGESEVRRRLAGSIYRPVRSEKYQLVEDAQVAAELAFAREANLPPRTTH
jgi:hypothetical protein